jgi:uncharacterized protein (TIGR03435 family)
MSGPILTAVINHLWQSTLFAGLAAVLALLLRRNSARLRYLVWLAASLKFLVPFAWLAAIGAWIGWPPDPASATDLSLAGQVVQSIVLPAGHGPFGPTQTAHAASPGSALLIILAMLWVAGVVAAGARWLSRWNVLCSALRQSTPASFPFAVPVRRCSAGLEPAVVGVLRPVLLLPEGLEERLTPAELRAVLSHERCHVLWRDNLAAALHLLVESLFWFHPLIWWLGARLIAERERACDEQVLAEGHGAAAYAEGILKVCEHFLQSGVPCAAGAGGADLKHRIEDIMKNPLIERLSSLKKACIIMVAGGALAAPVVAGLFTATRAHAQDTPATTGEPAFSNVSIQLAPAGDVQHFTFMFREGKLEIRNSTLLPLITAAYDVQESQVFGRQWSGEPRYDITATTALAPGPAASAALRDLLTRQFGLVVKHELRQMDGYVLLLSSGGSKLKPGQLDPFAPRLMNFRAPGGNPPGTPLAPASLTATNVPVSMLPRAFSTILHAPVTDETGLQGDFEYAYQVSWQPAAPDTALLAKSLQEQLGLTLEARPLNIDTIDVVSLKPAQAVLTAPR